MRWVNGETRQHKRDRLSKWHLWFAWYPVSVDIVDGHKIKAWLEYVERHIEFHGDWGDSWTTRTYRVYNGEKNEQDQKTKSTANTQ